MVGLVVAVTCFYSKTGSDKRLLVIMLRFNLSGLYSHELTAGPVLTL